MKLPGWWRRRLTLRGEQAAAQVLTDNLLFAAGARMDQLQARIEALEKRPDLARLESEIHQLGVLLYEATNIARRFLKERVPQ